MSQVISDAHFGGHLLLTKDATDAEGPFTRLTLEAFGHTHLRYPGGTVTEELSHLDGSLNRIFQDVDTNLEGGFQVSAHAAMRYAVEHNIAIQWVMPTETFFTEGAYGERVLDTDALDAHIDQMMDLFAQYPEAVVSSVEIGNEYWYANERMTAGEYGRVADAAAVRLQDAFDAYTATPQGSDWTEPGIAVQSGAGWRPGENETILAGLSMDARAAIDLVVAHYYPGSLEDASQRYGVFGNLQDFRDTEGFGDIKAFLSEWNIHNVEAGDKGFAHASGLIEAFDVLVAQGVEVASVWGTNYSSLGTRLSGTSANPGNGTALEDITTWLTPAGEVYRMMQESLIGKTRAPNVLEGTGLDGIDGIEVWAYEGDGETVVFAASRTEDPTTLQIDPSEWGPPGSHVWAMELSPVDLPRAWNDNSQAQEPWARAQVTTHNAQDLATNGITLEGYGIVRITITHDPEQGVWMRGGDQDTNGSPADDDVLVGTDGNDTIEGNQGDDHLTGGEGRDLLIGGAGDDTLVGGEGVDILMGGEGSNLVEVGPEGAFVWSEGTDNVVLSAAGPERAGSVVAFSSQAQSNVAHFDPTQDTLLVADGGTWANQDGNSVWTHPDGGSVTIQGGEAHGDGWWDSLRPWSDGEGRLTDTSNTLAHLDAAGIEAAIGASSGLGRRAGQQHRRAAPTGGCLASQRHPPPRHGIDPSTTGATRRLRPRKRTRGRRR